MPFEGSVDPATGAFFFLEYRVVLGIVLMGTLNVDENRNNSTGNLFIFLDTWFLQL